MAVALLAALVESSNDAVASKTLDGIVTSWNSAAERLFGYTAAEMIGQPIAVLSAPERQAEMPMILERIRRGERLDSFDTTRRRKDGSVVEISLTVSPIYDAAGRIVGASKIARDISERRAAERQQQLLLGELDHRVRNTLMVVLGLTSQTLSPGPEREALLGRLHAIAHGQALLSAPNRRPVRIRELITAELAAFEDHVAVSGDRPGTSTQGGDRAEPDHPRTRDQCGQAWGALSSRRPRYDRMAGRPRRQRRLRVPPLLERKRRSARGGSQMAGLRPRATRDGTPSQS